MTNGHISQITILPKSVLDDYFYLCVSIAKQKIICVYGVTTFKNNINTASMLNIFIFIGQLLITTLIILCLMIIINNII